MPCSDRITRHHGVVEGVDNTGDDLALLVAFARDDQDVSCFQLVDRGRDRKGAVADLARVGTRGQNFGANCRRFFAAGIIVRHDDLIGIARRDLAHAGALGAIAVAPGTEDDPQPMGRMGSKGI